MLLNYYDGFFDPSQISQNIILFLQKGLRALKIGHSNDINIFI